MEKNGWGVRSIHRERNFEIARCGQKVVHLDKSIVAFQIKLLLECGKGTTEQLWKQCSFAPLWMPIFANILYTGQVAAYLAIKIRLNATNLFRSWLIRTKECQFLERHIHQGHRWGGPRGPGRLRNWDYCEKSVIFQSWAWRAKVKTYDCCHLEKSRAFISLR